MVVGLNLMFHNLNLLMDFVYILLHPICELTNNYLRICYMAREIFLNKQFSSKNSLLQLCLHEYTVFWKSLHSQVYLVILHYLSTVWPCQWYIELSSYVSMMCGQFLLSVFLLLLQLRIKSFNEIQHGLCVPGFHFFFNSFNRMISLFVIWLFSIRYHGAHQNCLSVNSNDTAVVATAAEYILLSSSLMCGRGRYKFSAMECVQ